MHIEKIYFKELTHWIVGSDKSKIYKAGQQAGNSGKELMPQS